MAALYGRFDYKERAYATLHIFHAHEDGWNFTWAKNSNGIIARKAWGAAEFARIPADPAKWSKQEFRAILSKWYDEEADSYR